MIGGNFGVCGKLHALDWLFFLGYIPFLELRLVLKLSNVLCVTLCTVLYVVRAFSHQASTAFWASAMPILSVQTHVGLLYPMDHTMGIGLILPNTRLMLKSKPAWFSRHWHLVWMGLQCEQGGDDTESIFFFRFELSILELLDKFARKLLFVCYVVNLACSTQSVCSLYLVNMYSSHLLCVQYLRNSLW